MIETALRELDSILRILESQLPANPESPSNQRLARSLEKSMREYFRQLEMALDPNIIEGLYYKLVKQE